MILEQNDAFRLIKIQFGERILVYGSKQIILCANVVTNECSIKICMDFFNIGVGEKKTILCAKPKNYDKLSK